MSDDIQIDYVEIMNAEEKDTEVSKCSSCGANMIYSPADQCLLCEFCGNKEELVSQSSQEKSLNDLLTAHDKEWSDSTVVICCSNCGAKEIVNKTDISKHCSFCGTTNVIETENLSGLKPNAVVPFELDKEKAKISVVTWAKKKIFSPSAFKKSVQPENIAGTYSPAFTFDTQTVTSYKGVLGRRETYRAKVNGKVVTKTRIVYFRIHGTHRSNFDDVLIQAGNTISQKNIEKMQPFDTNNSKKYDDEYLHGFTASQYSKDGQCCWSEAKSSIKSAIRKRILSQYQHCTVKEFHSHTTYNNVTFKYILLPIYVGHFEWKAKLFNFFVNGRNGKVAGKVPVSPVRVGIAVACGLLLIVGLLCLNMMR